VVHVLAVICQGRRGQRKRRYKGGLQISLRECKRFQCQILSFRRENALYQSMSVGTFGCLLAWMETSCFQHPLFPDRPFRFMLRHALSEGTTRWDGSVSPNAINRRQGRGICRSGQIQRRCPLRYG